MARTYVLQEPVYKVDTETSTRKVLAGAELAKKARALKKSIKDSHRIIESAQKKCSRSGKDKSLLHQACKLGHIVNANPITRDGKKYVNPMTNGDRLYLEEVGTYKSVEFLNNQFKDITGNFVNIVGYLE